MSRRTEESLFQGSSSGQKKRGIELMSGLHALFGACVRAFYFFTVLQRGVR